MALHRAQRQPQEASHLGMCHVLEKAKFEDASLRLTQAGQLVGEQHPFHRGLDLGIRRGVLREILHRLRGAPDRTPMVGDLASGDPQQPRRKRTGIRIEALAPAPGGDEHRLGHIRGIGLVPAAPPGDRVDQRGPPGVHLVQCIVVSPRECRCDVGVGDESHRLPP